MPDCIQLTTKEQTRLDLINAVLGGKMTNSQAAAMLGLSLRQVKRLKKKVKEQGGHAVIHQLKGQAGNHHLAKSLKEQSLSLIKEKYPDFRPTFASEKLAEQQGLIVNPQTLRKWLIEAGGWKVRHQKQIKYHALRERLEYFGQMQQFDGSYHLWFEKRLLDELGNPVELCLLAAIDDATGQITQAKFDFNEGVVAVFNFWKEYVKSLGKPLKLYLDKFSTYKVNHKNAIDNSELLTQFQKSCQILNIELISANSPQAKGRVERLFQTLQDRLVKELRLADIKTVAEGNTFLQEIFLPQFNAKFSVIPTKSGNIHKQLTKAETLSLNSIFSIKCQRRINYDFTIQFKNHFYQLEEIQPVTIRPKDKVTVEEHLDQTLQFVFKGQQLKYFVLQKKPEKLSSQPVILTTHPLNWKPPLNHPWRQYKQKQPNLEG